MTPEMSDFAGRLDAWRAVPRDEQARACGLAPRRPSAWSMARSFLAAILGHLGGGARRAPSGVRAARLAACRACPLHDPARDACRKCGCGVPARGGLALKRSWASSRCPADPPRWDAC